MAPEFPALKASGLIMVNVLFVAMGFYILIGLNRVQKYSFSSQTPKKSLDLYLRVLIFKEIRGFGIAKKILTFATH
jgi:hypothetical protein